MNDEIIAIIIPIYKIKLNKTELFSLRRVVEVLKDYDIYFICPQNLEIDFQKEYGCFREDFAESFFLSISGYNQLMLSEEFYRRFIDYEYLLIYQLDAFIYNDNLKYFCELGYDYIGAPWFYGAEFHEVNGEKFKTLVGNGGFSLRKTSKFKKITHKYRDFFKCNLDQNEDVLYSYLGYKKEITVAPENIALQFSNEVIEPEVLDYSLTLPMGCHAWIKYYKKDHIQSFLKLGLDISEIQETMESEEIRWRRFWYYKLFFEALFLNETNISGDLCRFCRGERCSVYGAGVFGKKVVQLLKDQYGFEIKHIFESEESKKILEGIPCEKYDIEKVQAVPIIISNLWPEEIQHKLEMEGLKEGIDFIALSKLCMENLEQYGIYRYYRRKRYKDIL